MGSECAAMLRPLQAMLHLWWRNLSGSDSPSLWSGAVVAIVSGIAVATSALLCRLCGSGDGWLSQAAIL